MHDLEYMEDVIARLRASLAEARSEFGRIEDESREPHRVLLLAHNGYVRADQHLTIGNQFRTALTPETSRYERPDA